MSEVDVKETVDNEEVEQAPAEELVDMILAGELHAANEKFNSIVEAKVIEKIEEEKHKISQTLFAEDDDEEEEGDDKKKKDDDDDDEEDEDDSPVGKADEGKIPPQFLKKGDDDSDDEEDDDDDKEDDDDEKEDTKEGITGDPEANEKALAKNRAMAKKYGQVRQGIPPEKKEEVEPEQSFDPGEASANVELPKDSFVSQVALHLSGKRH